MYRPVVGIDFDGTIVDCWSKQLSCLKAAASIFGFEIDATRAKNDKRNGMNNKSALQHQNVSGDNINQVMDFWLENIESDRFLTYDRVFPGYTALLTYLKYRCDLHLISARSNSDKLLSQIRNLGLADIFTTVNIVSPKQAATEKSSVIRKLGLDVYVGDTESDYEACKSSGTRSVLVSSGQRSYQYIAALCGVSSYPHLYAATVEVLNVQQSRSLQIP